MTVSQEVMREWDADGSGMVGVSELSAAATAYKKVRGLVLRFVAETTMALQSGFE